MKRKIYLAAPLFSDAEKSYNKNLKEQLSPFFDVYLPQEDGLLVVDLMRRGISFQQASQQVFSADLNAIRKCNILLIVLDGRTIDEGAAMELGYAYSLEKECIGISTDPRSLLPDGQNPMISCCLDVVVENAQQATTYLQKEKEIKVCMSS